MVKKLNNQDIMLSNGRRALAFRRVLADNTDFFKHVKNYLLLGATETQIAEFYGTDIDTWLYWKKHSAPLRDAMLKGGALADAQVAAAMHKRATGYEFKREKVVVNKDGHGEIVMYDEHIPPDTSAGKFWLTNRAPNWSDKTEHNLAGKVDVDKHITVEFIGVTQPPLNITDEAATT
jgi:hypothetical protein